MTKTALITGATGGLGSSICKKFMLLIMVI